MSYYASKTGKIVHTDACRYVHMIPAKKMRVFNIYEQAASAGYVRCKYCCQMRKYWGKDRKELAEFCESNGISYEFNRAEGCVDVKSKQSKWKIIVYGKNHSLFLYHKDVWKNKKPKFINGYHSQKVRENSILGYMQYIAGHDSFREENPLYKPKEQKPADGIANTNRILIYAKVMYRNLALTNVLYK